MPIYSIVDTEPLDTDFVLKNCIVWSVNPGK